MIFVQNRYSGLLALLSGEPISASTKTSNPFCSRGLRPLEPQQGAAPVTHWGPGTQTPRPPHLLPGGPPAPSAAYLLVFSYHFKSF